MSRKHEKTLAAVKKVAANLKWKDIEAMFIHYGGQVHEGRGSRVRVLLNGVVAVFHRPHNPPTPRRDQVRSVKRFVENAGL